jgi:hypothetical protein
VPDEHQRMILAISKKYKIITPTGEEIYVYGLKQFCKSYKKEKLCDSTLIKVAKGIHKHHKGYKCEYLEEQSQWNII